MSLRCFDCLISIYSLSFHPSDGIDTDFEAHSMGPVQSKDLPQVVCFSGQERGILIFPKQRKLMGSSAQISSGVCRCGLQEQVPEEGSGRFQRVLWCAGVGSGGRFRKVPESSGVCWCRFRRRKVPAYAGVGSGGKFRKVPESSGVKYCRFRFWRQVRSGR